MSHSYPSDISREQFARIMPVLESARRRTKPRVKGGEKTCHWGGVKLYHLGGA